MKKREFLSHLRWQLPLEKGAFRLMLFCSEHMVTILYICQSLLINFLLLEM